MQGGSIVPIQFEPMPRKVVAPDFIERAIEQPGYSAKGSQAADVKQEEGVVSVSTSSTAATTKAKDIVFADH